MQAWLDRMDAAVLGGDFETYAAGVSLPFTLITETANLTVADEADLRRGFDAWRDMLRMQHVTDSVRLCSGVTHLAPDLVVGTYISHLLSNAKPVVPSKLGAIILRLEDGAWRATAIASPVANRKWPIDLPRPGLTEGP